MSMSSTLFHPPDLSMLRQIVAVCTPYFVFCVLPYLIFVSKLPGRRPSWGTSPENSIPVRVLALIVNIYLWTFVVLATAGSIIESTIQCMWLDAKINTWYHTQLLSSTVSKRNLDEVLDIVLEGNHYTKSNQKIPTTRRDDVEVRDHVHSQQQGTRASGTTAGGPCYDTLTSTTSAASMYMFRNTIASVGLVYLVFFFASYDLFRNQAEPSMALALGILCMPLPVVLEMSSANLVSASPVSVSQYLQSLRSQWLRKLLPAYPDPDIGSNFAVKIIHRSASFLDDDSQPWNIATSKQTRLDLYLQEYKTKSQLGDDCCNALWMLSRPSRTIPLLHWLLTMLVFTITSNLSFWYVNQYQTTSWNHSLFLHPLNLWLWFIAAILSIDAVFSVCVGVEVVLASITKSSLNSRQRNQYRSKPVSVFLSLAVLIGCFFAYLDALTKKPAAYIRDPSLRPQSYNNPQCVKPDVVSAYFVPSLIILAAKPLSYFRGQLETRLGIWMQSSHHLRAGGHKSNLSNSKTALRRVNDDHAAGSWACAENAALTKGDVLKTTVERVFGLQMIWWPLAEPNRPLKEAMERMTWECTCGSIVSFDVPRSVKAKSGTKHRGIASAAASNDNDSILPIHHSPGSSSVNTSSTLGQSSSNSALPGSNTDKLSRVNNNQVANGSGQTGSKTTTNTMESYIYYCVNDNNKATRVTEFSVKKHTDASLIAGLRQYYHTINGRWHGFWTMTSCAGVSFRKFRYLFDDTDLVTVHTIPELPIDKQYQYTRIDPLEEYRAWLEARVSHYIKFHRESESQTQNPSANDNDGDLLTRIPKKVPIRLAAIAYNQGHGMYAITQLSLAKVLIMLILWQSGSIAFGVYWLCIRKGDLQNAFVVLGSTIAGFVLYLEVLVRLKM